MIACARIAGDGSLVGESDAGIVSARRIAAGVYEINVSYADANLNPLPASDAAFAVVVSLVTSGTTPMPLVAFWQITSFSAGQETFTVNVSILNISTVTLTDAVFSVLVFGP